MDLDGAMCLTDAWREKQLRAGSVHGWLNVLVSALLPETAFSYSMVTAAAALKHVLPLTSRPLHLRLASRLTTWTTSISRIRATTASAARFVLGG